MFYHILNQRILYVGRIGHSDLFIALAGLKTDGFIVEDAEAQLTLSTYYLDTVLAGTLVSNIAP